MRRPLACSVSFVAVLALTLAACGDGKKAPLPAAGGAPAPSPAAAKGGDPAAAAAATASEDDALIAKYKKDLDLPIVKYEWDRNAGDKSVPAELGGPGFTGEGWTTRLEFPTTAWPQAPQGGTLRTVMYDWPATLRVCGENNNSTFNDMVQVLCMETLLQFNPVIMDYIPALATHWKISEDKQTYSFRINPEARWSDGTEVTADDVVATWKLRMDPKCMFPSDVMTFGKFDQPVAKSKYILEVHCREENWRNFLYFASDLFVMPAKEISIPGDQYLDKFQNAYHAMSGPYTVKMEDIKSGESVALTRRHDYWGDKNPANAGNANLEKIVFQVVQDQNLAYEKVKKGELDYFIVPRALWWATEIPKFDSVQRGLLVMKKIYDDAAIGTNGVAINMLRPPLDDLRIRQALQNLFNRRMMIEKLCYNEYEPLTSYHQGGVYENPDNKEDPYDPRAAVGLLEQAGWTGKNDELYRVKDGKELKLKLIYRSKLSEKFLTIFQEDCRKAGIRLELELLTDASHFKAVQDKEFDLAEMAWTGLFFPNPETSYKSELADSKGNNNISGFKDKRVDALCAEYDKCYDASRRAAIIREIDGIVYAAHPFALMWYLPSQRFVYWNKFGMPPWGCARTARSDQAFFTFWVDKDKEKALEAARADPAKTMPKEEEKNFFWRAWNANQRNKPQSSEK